MKLEPSSLYGIRVYTEGAILAPHVDRLPLVSSCIINVAQDVEEPWLLEVYDRNDRAVNVTMEPGDMVLYESHSVIHGRPYALKGRFMANIFIHFEPTGHSLRHNILNGIHDDVDQKYRQAQELGQAGHEHEERNGLPSYVLMGGTEEAHWRMQHPAGQSSNRPQTFTTGSTEAHSAAQQGKLDELKQHVARDKSIVNKQDSNGWTPLHEGARGGHLEVVRYLVDQGADINALTKGTGATALWWAKHEHGEDHPIIEFLESLGAVDSGPEL